MTVRIIFVIPDDQNDESSASQAMHDAFNFLKTQVTDISWKKEAELSALTFSEFDYLVFEAFGNRDFKKYIDSEAVVLGPLAASVCFIENKPIPPFKWPMESVAMYGCEVNCSQVGTVRKNAIKEKVHLMGGYFNQTGITTSLTHLISNGAKSEKYYVAAEKNIPILLPAWIDALYERSKTTNINANDPELLQQFRCPPFQGLTIVCTGLNTSREKNEMKDLIEKHGGKFTGKMLLAETDVLICAGSTGTTSEKFKAARGQKHIKCVTPEWLYDSVKKLVGQPPENYRVKTMTSTPTKEGENVDPNFSTISLIGGSLQPKKSVVDETLECTPKRGSLKRKADESLVEKIDIKKAKSAGQFLDGCSIFVAGFSPDKRDKVHRVINISGATRYDEYNERVSHVIVGDRDANDVKMVKSCSAMVTLQWLLDSIDAQHPVDENKYLIDQPEVLDAAAADSPMSKKLISFIRDVSIVQQEQPPTVLEEDTLTKKYLQSQDTLANVDMPDDGFEIKTRRFNPQDTSTQISQLTDAGIFAGKTLYLEGFDQENYDLYKRHIIDCGGSVVDKKFKGVCDYVIVPVIYQVDKVIIAHQELVNQLWLVNTLDNNAISDMEYFYQPINMTPISVLDQCVVAISGYLGEERDFLQCLIEALGGIYQESLSRKLIPRKNVLASTHLIIPNATGKKYQAAVNWNLVIVTKDWLMACIETKTRVPCDPYLVESPLEDAPVESTPKKQVYNLDGCSQVTPIHKILQDAVEKKILPTPSPKQRLPWDPKTPDTPLGAFMNIDPSPATRKEFQRYVDSFPDFKPQLKRRISTPLSELKRKLLDKVLKRGEYAEPAESAQPQPEQEESQTLKKLEELKQKLRSSTSSKRASRVFEHTTTQQPSGVAQAESQPFSVGWDYGFDQSQQQRVFLLSGIDASMRQQLSEQLTKLGGRVLDSPGFDSSCTHLLCSKPGRNEKTLACMASGKWVLHFSYALKSVENGGFLNEEDFEFGNPKASVSCEEKDQCIHFWRKEIARRGYGAFNDMRAVVVAEKREPITNVIEAGGGVVLNIEPPYEDSIHATHFLLEIKMVKDFSKYVNIAQQGIKIVNTIYVNDFLFRSKKDDVDYIVPYFAKFYK